MAKTLEISVPDEVHEALTERAAQAGVSVSEYLLREVEKLVERPTVDELIERIRDRGPIDLGISAAELVREAREERDRELEARWSSLIPPL